MELEPAKDLDAKLAALPASMPREPRKKHRYGFHRDNVITKAVFVFWRRVVQSSVS
jgi:hypothetical protein